MTEFSALDFPEHVENSYSMDIPNRSDCCFCCLLEKVPFVRLLDCKHVVFFENYFKYKLEYLDLMVCHCCHSMLVKIEKFKLQVESSIKKLNQLNCGTNKSTEMLQYSQIEITSAFDSGQQKIELIDSKIKKKSQMPEGKSEKYVDVKIEQDKYSDPENEVPGAEIKEKNNFGPINCNTMKYTETLQYSQIEITSACDSGPLTFELIDTTISQVPPSDKSEEVMDVKIEYDNYSDPENEVPLSEIKEKNNSGPQSFVKKYEGKIKVIVLTAEELQSEREAEALNKKYVELPFKCEDCVIGFNHEVLLKEHKEKRHSQTLGSILCNICKSVLSTDSSYKEHMRRHHKRFECVECGKRYTMVRSAETHYSKEHGALHTEFTCNECGFVAKTHRSYRYHRDKHRQTAQCSECVPPRTFVNNAGLKTHMLTVHKISDRVFACAQCGKAYGSRSGLLAHAAAAHSAGAGAYCAPCAAHFKTEHNLKVHLATHSRHVNESDMKFVCASCGARFRSGVALREHVNWVHLKTEVHKCPQCDKVLKHKRSLAKHVAFVHEKVRPPRNKICDHCGRGFTSMTILRTHIRTHTGERPLSCRQCSATFAHSAALYTHTKLLHRGK